jgi:hypothetical protein
MVKRMRRLFAALAVFSLAVTAFLAAPAAAFAGSAGLHSAAEAGTCPGQTYPPEPNATVMASTTTPFAGQKIEASGTVYCPDEDVTLTIAGKFVGTAHTDASGAFDPQVVPSGPPGDKQLCGIGASGLSNDQDCLTLHVTAGHGVEAAGTGGGGGLAFTGAQVTGLIALAVVLVVGGAFFTAAGHRRKSHARG